MAENSTDFLAAIRRESDLKAKIQNLCIDAGQHGMTSVEMHHVLRSVSVQMRKMAVGLIAKTSSPIEAPDETWQESREAALLDTIREQEAVILVLRAQLDEAQP